MSVQAIGWVLEFSESRLGPRHVLISIANHAKADGTGAWPSVSTIAHESRLSEREVRYALRELEQIGELSTAIGSGPQGCNLYSLPKMGQILLGQNPTRQGQNTTRGGQNPAENVSEFAPEPKSIKPSLKQPSLKQPTPGIVVEPKTEPEGFLLFWECYPEIRRGVKGEAFRAWVDIPSAELHLGDVLRGLEVWKASGQWQKEGGSYVPSARRFLLAKQWSVRPPEGSDNGQNLSKHEQRQVKTLEAAKRVMERHRNRGAGQVRPELSDGTE